MESLTSTPQDEKSFDRLQPLGVVAWEQVLLLLPSGVNDYTKIKTALPFDTLYPTPLACYKLRVTSTPNKSGVSPPRLTFTVTDGNVAAGVTVFGDIFAWSHVKKDDVIVIEAVLDVFNGYLNLKSPTLIPNKFAGKLVATYRGKKGANKSKTISPEFIYTKTRDALAHHIDATANYLLSFFNGFDLESLVRRSKISFQTLQEMLIAIHSPKSMEEFDRGMAAARQIAAYEVIFNAQAQMARKPTPKSVINIRQADIETLISKFPHQMTEHQLTAISEITDDLRRPFTMMRLLSGDVGFGKTDTALIPAIAAHYAGAKVVIMAPSLLIVGQWIEKISQYDKSVPIQVVSGSVKINKEQLILNPIMVGTTALITRLPKIKFVADLVIFDEQQKNGKAQRESLTSPNTNRLEATATCQPQTAALVLYGGMSQSILNQCPVEKKIYTRIVQQDERSRLFTHLQRVLDEVSNSQIAIVYPNVADNKTKTSLLSSAAGWERKFPGQVGVLHGKLSDAEKVAIIDAMHSGKIRVLLSSVLIETGLTLPSLRAMVVIGADMFGVSSLHQLRGRLSRHGGTGYFFMYMENKVADETFQRLELLVQHTDGFVLAEKDAELRGFGSILDESAGQSGRSRSAMFSSLSLMPKDIAAALNKP